PGIQMLVEKPEIFSAALTRLGIRVWVALTLTKPRGISRFRHAACEVRWHQRWLHKISRREQVQDKDLQSIEGLLEKYQADRATEGDERDHRIFAGLEIAIGEAANKSLREVETLLRERIEKEATSKATERMSRARFQNLLEGTDDAAPDEV